MNGNELIESIVSEGTYWNGKFYGPEKLDIYVEGRKVTLNETQKKELESRLDEKYPSRLIAKKLRNPSPSDILAKIADMRITLYESIRERNELNFDNNFKLLSSHLENEIKAFESILTKITSKK